jgi:hypothetical protein
MPARAAIWRPRTPCARAFVPLLVVAKRLAHHLEVSNIALRCSSSSRCSRCMEHSHRVLHTGQNLAVNSPAMAPFRNEVLAIRRFFREFPPRQDPTPLYRGVTPRSLTGSTPGGAEREPRAADQARKAAARARTTISTSHAMTALRTLKVMARPQIARARDARNHCGAGVSFPVEFHWPEPPYCY